MHHCLNVVTGPVSFPAALLIRAVEPLEGADVMHRARQAAGRRPVSDARLATGPGLVGTAFGIDRTLTGTDLCDPASGLHLEPAPDGEASPQMIAAPRVGIAYAGEPWVSVPWRFLVVASPSAGGGAR